MEQAGVTVVPRKLDITSKESLHLCYQAITRTLPPIAGVANGAMLLQDVLFKDMDAANLNKVLAPKYLPRRAIFRHQAGLLPHVQLGS
ncbi:hypothetical protein LB505_009284 [Fusarium chuoi]|nr:hypothetical protein LB505_009284 [Fusarium chuoi]